MTALGILAQLNAQGIRVPGEVSVCGFDNVFSSAITTPSLTTIDHHLRTRCQAAVDMVTSRPAPSALPVPFVNKIEYTPQLVVRGSTGKGANGDGGGLKLSETGCREDNGNAQRRAPKHRGYCPREALFSPGRNGPVDHAWAASQGHRRRRARPRLQT